MGVFSSLCKQEVVSAFERGKKPGSDDRKV